MNKEKLTAIDVFCGGGGLTLGLKRGGFNVIAGIDNNMHAVSTFKANHSDVNVFNQDVSTIKGNSLKKLSANGKIDLIAGCPPCQGFTSLTHKYKRIDPRNKLIYQMQRLIKEIRPKVIMMENVPGLEKKGKHYLSRMINSLVKMGYCVNYKILQVADYGVPQNRRRLVLLAGKGFEIPMPRKTHSRNGESGLKTWNTLRDTICKVPEPVTLSKAKTTGGPQYYNWHVIRDLSPINTLRLKYSKAGESRARLPDKLRPQCHKNKDFGFSNVYGRMNWDSISVTITAGCTTLSKGRFGHPDKDRTLSVREAALVQTFPMDYIIDTPYMEHACNIVGNALPCDFAEVLSRQCYKYLQENLN